MNVKLPLLTIGVLFFSGQSLMAQKKQTGTKKPKIDTVSNREIEEVVVQGYRSVTKKTAAVSSATISNETIENRPNANVLNTIQGQLAGVNIVAGSGQPGAKPEVIIRGVGTINGNYDPLYVIDGFPSNSDNFRTLNPNDIESMDVLKDAAALAEYGSRGSNGVIIIKTKRGSYNSKTSIRYSGQTGVSVLQGTDYNMANSKELLTIEKNKGVGKGKSMTEDQIAAFDINTDWTKYFFRPAITTSHNLAIENGGKNINSYSSLGYFNQDGILNTTGLQRFTLRNNLNGKTDNGKLRYSVNTSIAHSKNNLATNLGTGGVNQNYVLGAFISVPYLSPSQYVDSQTLMSQSGGTLLYTPLYLMDKLKTFKYLTEETRIDAVTDLSYKFTEDLTGRVKTSGQLLLTRNLVAQYPVSFNSLYFEGQNGYTGRESIGNRREFLFNNLWSLNYKKILGNHTFELSGNAEFNSSNLNNNGFTQYGLDPLTYVPDTGAGYISDTSDNDYHVPYIYNSRLKLNMISYFGSFDYDFNKRFGVVASVRTDGTNRFNKGYQWGSFWSVGGRWNLEEESFIKDLNFINMLKLRGSYGTVGNQRYVDRPVGNQRYVDGTIYAGLVPPGYMDSYSLTSSAVYMSGQGYSISFGYPPLTWETTKTYNVGVDFELFSRRFRGTFDKYERKTTNLFFSDPTSAILGTTSIDKNTDMVVKNAGYELSLAYDIIKNEDWIFTLRGNGAYNKQTLHNMSSEIDGGNLYYGNGHPMAEYYVYHYLGVNPENGNMWFESADGTPTETPKDEDRKLTGKNLYPKYQGGFGFDLTYKGFFVSSTFTYVAGIQRFDFDMLGYYDTDNLGSFNVSKDLLNAWTPTNTNTNIPSLTGSGYEYMDLSDRFLVDASYIRLRNLQVGYSLPKSLLKDTFMDNLTVTLQGENLVTFTKWKGYDPESNRAADQYQYPTPRIITLGFDVKF